MFEQALYNGSQLRFWIELSDIPASTRELWKSLTLNSTVLAETNYLPIRITSIDAQRRKNSLISLLNTVTSEWDKLTKQFVKPHLFIFTDTSGIVLEMKGTEQVMMRLQDCNIGKGTSFAMEHAGVNGISLAMEMQKPAIVKGQEHYLELFSQWSCVCQPVIIDGEIKGYLDLSTHSEEDFTWAFVLLGKLVMDIEQQVVSTDPLSKQTAILQSFGQYGLSSREKEIAWRWLNNQSTLRIAEELYIAEGTVRNHIKKVYAKTGVREKGKFMRKFV
jgi:transcriptional regulator of acetoin/glycerol metabolism